MRARLVCLLLMVAATPALAQDPGAPISIPGGGPVEPPAPRGPPPPQLFISPAGEPFHAEPGQPYPVALWFGRADADHDEGLSREEFLADSMAFFDRLDTDRDRVVDGFEVADYERNVAPEITGVLVRRDRPDGGPPPEFPTSRAEQVIGAPTFLHPRGAPRSVRRQGAAQYGLLNEPHPVRGADADLDQRVSRAEAEAAARRRFALLDADHDGRITRAELPVTPAQTMDSAPPERPRRKTPAKPVEMPLQPTTANAIEIAAPATLSRHETP
ncbi:MAG: hypothetical protein ACOYM5_03885 [Caulobacter sp.]|jgi:hypothetical protein